MKHTINRVTDRVSRTAAILQLSMGRMGNERTVSPVARTDDGPEWVRPHKRLFDSQEWQAIKNLQTKATRLVETYSVPCDPPLGGGMHLLPVAYIDRVANRLESFRKEMSILVDAFVRAYPSCVVAARDDLGDLYNPEEYKPQSEVADEFHLDYWIRPVDTGVHSAVRGATLKRELRKAEVGSAQLVAGARKRLRSCMLELVRHVVQVLNDGKVVKAAAFANLEQFARLFPPKNEVVCDDALAGVVERAAKLVGGADLKAIRRDDAVRRQVARMLGEIEAELASMLSTASDSNGLV